MFEQRIAELAVTKYGIIYFLIRVLIVRTYCIDRVVEVLIIREFSNGAYPYVVNMLFYLLARK